MTNYVTDASIIIELLVGGEYTAQVKGWFESLTESDELFVPEFCLVECANVLWKRVRFHGMPLEQAERLEADLTGLPLEIVPAARLLRRAIQIGVAQNLAIYDSVYIALAEKLRYPLITVDRRQAEAATREGIELKSITDFSPLT